MSGETTGTLLVTCPDCGRVWDGFAQCFPCEPPSSPATSTSEGVSVSSRGSSTVVKEETSEKTVVSTDLSPDLEDLPGYKDPQDFFADIGRAADDDAAWKRVRRALR